MRYMRNMRPEQPLDNPRPPRPAPANDALVARGGAVNALGNVAGFIDPLFIIFVSHALGAAILGSYVLASTYVALLLRIGMVGMDKGLLRYVPMAQEASPAEVRAVIGTAVRASLVISVLCAAVVLLIASWLVNLGGENPDGLGAWWLSWMILALPGQAISMVLLTAIRGTSRMLPFIVVQNVVSPAVLLAVAALGVAFGGSRWALVTGYLTSAYVVMAVSVYLFRRHFPDIGFTSLFRGPKRRDLLSFSIPQGATDLLNLMLGRIDIIMIAAFFPGKPEFVAVYAVASMLAGTVKKIRLAFDGSLSPVLSRLMARGETDELWRVYRQTANWIALLFVLYGGALSLGAPLALHLAGSEFSAHWMIVPILVLGRYLNAAGGPTQTALLMGGYSRLELINNLATNFGNVLLNLLMIPIWGPYGAAAATSISLTLFNLVRMMEVKHLLGLTPPFARIARITAAAALAALPALALQQLWPGLTGAGAAAAVYFIGCLGTLWMFGLKRELRTAWSLLRVKPGQRSAAMAQQSN